MLCSSTDSILTSQGYQNASSGDSGCIKLRHFLHHVHNVLGTTHLLKHARVHGFVQLLHNVIGVTLHLLSHVRVTALHKAGLTHFRNHLFKLSVAIKELANIKRVRSGTTGNTVNARRSSFKIDMAIQLFVCHGVHHVHETLKAIRTLVIIYTQLIAAEHLRHAWYHGHYLVEGTKLHDIFKLLIHVTECERSLGESIHELRAFVIANGIFNLSH
mmetsp:Transcript_26548/g.81617  ORF Transcript_26548/g.81617 Transcript_26548/m.81617 type:complete len:215 (+) Transcript_26548:751-1395(+)